MNQSSKKLISVETSVIRPIQCKLPEAEGGVTLFKLGSASAAAHRIAIRRLGEKPARVDAVSFVQPNADTDGSAPPVSAAKHLDRKRSAESKEETRHQVERILNLLLADEYALYKITRDYHWNVTGADYFSLRLLFQLQHEETAGWVDAVSEKIREMHFDKRVSWEDLKASARCVAAPGLGLPAKYMLAELLGAYDQVIARLHSDSDVCLQRCGEASIFRFLSGLREQHENAAWMLRAQLETEKITK